MKRGNTALKRGVGLASAFALAIAGAVVAAPAASAAGLVTPTEIRTTPIANAPFISADALITKIGDFDAANVYDRTAAKGVGTGAVPTISVGDSQAVAGLQILIPSVVGATAFDASDAFTVTLSGNATFAGSPTVDITRTPVRTAELATKAGWAGADLFGSPRATEAAIATAGDLDTASATPTAALSQLSANRSQRIKGEVSTDGTTLTVTLLQNDPNAGGAALAGTEPGYLVTVSGISVNVKDNAAAVSDAVTAELAGGDATTIAYLSPYEVSVADGAGYTVLKNGDVELPDVTIAEASKVAFDSGAATVFELSASGDAQEKVPAPTVEFTGAGTASLGSAALSGATPNTSETTVAAADALDAKLQSTTLSGAVVSGLKAGADLTLTVIAPVTTSTPAAGFAQTPSQSSVATLTIKQSSSAPRIAGTNRYATAGQIASRIVEAQGGPLNAVVLANGITAKDGVDALSANYLAGAHSAAILLTDSSDSLPQATQDALVKVLKGSAGADNTVTIYALGATDSVSAAALARAEFIAKAAVNSGVTVKSVRLDGTNRYKTSAKVVNEPGKANVGSYNLGKGSLNTAFLASGTVNADALAAGAVAAGANIPVLLTDGKTLDEDVAKSIKDNDIKQVIVLGSTDRVSDALVKALSDDNGVTNVVRIAGADRYETAADLAAFAIKASADGGLNLDLGSTAYLANGREGFPDALSVGPLAGLNNNALLTVPVTSLPKSTSDFLSATANKAAITWIEALGATDRISDELVAAAQKAIGF